MYYAFLYTESLEVSDGSAENLSTAGKIIAPSETESQNFITTPHQAHQLTFNPLLYSTPCTGDGGSDQSNINVVENTVCESSSHSRVLAFNTPSPLYNCGL